MKLDRFARYALGVLIYNLLVILWGAYVRTTGSGAGCGSHWPLCNGEVIPRTPQIETVIEFIHRMSSGLALLLVVGLVVWAVQIYPKGALIRLGAWWAMFFMLTESLIGAALVVFEMVGSNSSVYRAIWMMVHLVNTFFLMIPLTLIPWWATGGSPWQWRQHRLVVWGLGLALLGVLWMGSSGAVAALGNTLYPSASLTEGLQQDFSPTAHFLIRLRILHPAIAFITGIYLVGLARFVRQHRPTLAIRRLSTLVPTILCIQALAGMLNIALMAPVWIQLIHLLLANLLWITLVLLSAEVLAQPAPNRETVPVSPSLHRIA